MTNRRLPHWLLVLAGWTRRHLGLRGGALLLCAYIWVLVGLGVFLGAAPARAGAFHYLVPGEVRAFLWWTPALLAAVTACWQSRKRLVILTLAALSFQPTIVFVSLFGSWALYVLGWGGDPLGWFAASYYLGLLGIVVLAAAVPSPPVAMRQLEAE